MKNYPVGKELRIWLDEIKQDIQCDLVLMDSQERFHWSNMLQVLFSYIETCFFRH